MDEKAHWENVYQTKAPDAVSWYQPHLAKSLELISQVQGNREAAIIDVGGGEATLVDDLLSLGYRNVSLLDVSEKAIEVSKSRLGRLAASVTWWAENIREANLPSQFYDVWHDRAVFHFLTSEQQRLQYIRQVLKSVKPKGHVVIATFGLGGPEKCSGLPTVRYDAKSLHDQLGSEFQLIESATESHLTPFGTTQQFVYCCYRLKA